MEPFFSPFNRIKLEKKFFLSVYNSYKWMSACNGIVTCLQFLLPSRKELLQFFFAMKWNCQSKTKRCFFALTWNCNAQSKTKTIVSFIASSYREPLHESFQRLYVILGWTKN